MTAYLLLRSHIAGKYKDRFVAYFHKKPTAEELIKAVNEDGYVLTEEMSLKLIVDGEVDYTSFGVEEESTWLHEEISWKVLMVKSKCLE